MSNGFRFGRRLRLPSMLEIKSELTAAIALDDGRKRHALANHLPETASWKTIGEALAAKERGAATPS